MEVKDCMKTSVIHCSSEITLSQAAEIMAKHHIGTLPVVNPESKLVGLVTLQDLVAFLLPDFLHMVENVDFVGDFGAIETRKMNAELLNQTIQQIMRLPVSVASDAGLVRASAILLEHNLSDLPVVDDQMHLVGIASHVDIGLLILSNWSPSVS